MTLSRLIKTVVFGSVLAGMATMATQEAAAWPWPIVNPEIYNSGDNISGAYFDPFTGRIVVRTDRTRVRESFLDPNRTNVDPGSMQFVDRVEVDANGVSWRVRGWSWTSFGVPHGNLQRTRVHATGIPGVDREENDRVLYSAKIPGDQVPGAAVPNRSQPGPQNNVRRPGNAPQMRYNPF
jgi:hypothetical protein